MANYSPEIRLFSGNDVIDGISLRDTFFGGSDTTRGGGIHLTLANATYAQ
jgi:hypothetical protein